jgi:fumarate reductase flavoprotein subunit
MREDHPSVDYREQALTRQPGQRMWVLADQEMMVKAPPLVSGWTKDKIMKTFDGGHPMFAKADNLDILAAKAGINPVGLAASVATYNRTIAEGATDQFGRQHRPVQVSKQPFYAVRVTAFSLLSFAGLAVDGKLRVVRSDGTPVTNLYAAGEVIGAGATSGSSFCSGSMVTPAITFGRLLGQRMLNFSA